jgi:predicted amidophosphoribosyltransferase
MGLFRRKSAENEVYRTTLCPYCKEPLRDSATTCVMCGKELPQAATAASEQTKAPSPAGGPR